MPTSWHPEAVRAQTVAARSYAVRLRDSLLLRRLRHLRHHRLPGLRRHQPGDRPHGNAAVKATNGTIVTYKGAAALTQFASSNGGHTAQGDHPYLAPEARPVRRRDQVPGLDPDDHREQHRGRDASVGTVRRLQITSRDGAGAWGGRVKTIKIIGSKKTVTVTGNSFYRAYGLRSELFTFGGSAATPVPAPQAPTPGPTIKPGAKYATFPRSYHSGSKVDLTLVNSAGQLRRYPVANGKLGTSATIGSGFSGYTHVVNAGDWNGDGYQDMIVRRTERAVSPARHQDRAAGQQDQHGLRWGHPRHDRDRRRQRRREARPRRDHHMPATSGSTTGTARPAESRRPRSARAGRATTGYARPATSTGTDGST